MPHPFGLSSFRRRRGLPAVASLAIALALTGCAAPRAPEGALRAAEQAIATAEQARVADYAASELGEARSSLQAAHEAVADEEMVRAARLADESRVSAEFALAKADAAKARAVNKELQDSTDALKQEMQRSSGDSP